MKHVFRFPALSLLVVALISGCNMPKSGPSLSQVQSMPKQVSLSSMPTTAQELPKVEIIDVDDAVSIQLANSHQPQTLADLSSGHSSNPDVVGKGDILEVTLWESPPSVLFGGAMNSLGSGTAQTVKLPEQIVGSNGMISIPFLGNVPVSGKTPEQIQKQIVAGLSRKAHQPQALVRLVQNNSANATIIRSGKSIRMPLTAHRERVLDAVAAVGGVESGVQDISLQLTRGTQVRTVALEHVTSNPMQNIVLRSGDVLTLMNKPLSFTALGAVTRNQRVEFAARGINLSEALGQIGGLLDYRADPRGLFVFRYQPLSQLSVTQQAAWREQGFSDHMRVPVVYRVNLQEPHALFWLQRFAMQDKDVLYVANAPASELHKFLSLLFSPVISGVSSVERLTN